MRYGSVCSGVKAAPELLEQLEDVIAYIASVTKEIPAMKNGADYWQSKLNMIKK